MHYGIRIGQDINIEYLYDAKDMYPMIQKSDGTFELGEWKSFIEYLCRPCLFKDGRVIAYLNPNDYSKDIDGSQLSDDFRNSVDTMIEFRPFWFRMPESGLMPEDENEPIEFEISDEIEKYSDKIEDQSPSGGMSFDTFYYGAYEGHVDSMRRLRSISGKRITTNTTYKAMDGYAKNNHSSIEIGDYFTCLLFTFIMCIKRPDILMRLAFVDNSRIWQTGKQDKHGLFYADLSGPIKAFGIENFLGSHGRFMETIYHTVPQQKKGIVLPSNIFVPYKGNLSKRCPDITGRMLVI